jgi:hypothetical protein
MRWFEVREYMSSAGAPGGKFRVPGRRAPGAGVLVVQEGTGWVMEQDGTREAVSAKSVVVWEAGEWVEYGSDDGLEAEEYWAAQEPEGLRRPGSRQPSVTAAADFNRTRCDRRLCVADPVNVCGQRTSVRGLRAQSEAVPRIPRPRARRMRRTRKGSP